MRESHRNATAGLIEISNDRGDLIGGLTATPIPGVMTAVLRHATTYVGWARDWDSEEGTNQDAYQPVCIGTNDDREVLIDEIERRAREAQS